MSSPLPPAPFFRWSQIVTQSKPVSPRSAKAKAEADTAWEFLVDVEDLTHDPDTGLPYPEPTTDRPSDEEVRDMLFAATCPATDGCPVEPDGTCAHGHPAWLRRLSLI